MLLVLKLIKIPKFEHILYVDEEYANDFKEAIDELIMVSTLLNYSINATKNYQRKILEIDFFKNHIHFFSIIFSYGNKLQFLNMSFTPKHPMHHLDLIVTIKKKLKEDNDSTIIYANRTSSLNVDSIKDCIKSIRLIKDYI